MRLSKQTFVLTALLSCVTISAFGQDTTRTNLDVIRRSVVFLYRINKAGQIREAGTGFLLGALLKSDRTHGYILLVTARHMVDPEWAGCPPSTDSLVAVFNKKNYDPQKDESGTVDQTLTQKWIFPSDNSVDIAVTILDVAAFNKLGTDNVPTNVQQLPSPNELRNIDSGSPIVSAGLLLGASGSKRDYPIFKFGFVSSVPEEKIPMNCCPTCTVKLETEWMIAASLVPGNSGSPIVYMPGSQQVDRRPFILGVQSNTFIGDDVAGMAPVQYLSEAIRRLNLVGSDLSVPGAPEPAVAASPAAAKSAAATGKLPQ